MSGPGAIVVNASGAVTDPGTSMTLSLGSAAAAKYRTSGPFDAIYLPSIRAMLLLNGVGLNFHSLEAVNYPTGMLGVALAITAASTAVQATSTHTFTAATRPADLDSYYITGKSIGRGFKFKTTLSTSGIRREIARGANLAATIGNIVAFFNNTGTNGTEYSFDDGGVYGTDLTAFLSALGISVSATTATTVTYQAIDYGVGGNSYLNTELVDSGGTWTVTNFSGGTAGTGTVPAAGTYGYRTQRVRSADNAASYASPVVSITQGGNSNINLTAFVAAPTRDAYDFHRWNRTTSGGSVFYRGADVAAGTGEPYVDSYSDATITGAFALKYDDRLYRPYTAGYPVKCSYGCLYKGRVFMGGARVAAKRTAGTANVTNASVSVTMTVPAHPNVEWIGRSFRVNADAQSYIIVDVNEGTRVLTLNIPYGGTNNATAAYTVTDDRNPFTVYYSEPLLPNNYPPANSLEGNIWSDDPSGISGMAEAWGMVVVWTQTGVHRLEGDTGSGFRMNPVGEGMGAYSGQSVVNVEGTLYWIGAGGIYEWGGSGDPRSLSKPQADAPVGILRTINRINLTARDGVVGNYNPTENLIRWYVPLDGSTTNRDVIVYDLQSRSFMLDTCENVTAVATVPDQNGTLRTVTGDSEGILWQEDYSVTDGAYGFERVAAVSSYTVGIKRITLTSAPLPTAGDALKGVPFVHITAADGTVQRGKIISNTSSTFDLASPLTTAPVNGDTIVVGGIWYRIRTGRWDLEEAFLQRGLPAVTTTHVPSTGQFWCAAAKDNDDPTVYAPGAVRGFTAADYGDASVSNGYKLFWFRRGKCRRLCVELFGFTLGTDFGIVGWMPSVASRDTVGG